MSANAQQDWSGTDSAVLQLLASLLAGQNRTDEAAGLLEYVLARDPDNREARRALAAIYLLLGRFSEALDMIVALGPVADGDPLMLVKGQALWELGLTQDASRVIDSYLTGSVTR